MNKHLLLILLGFGLIGCATSNLYILEDVRESGKNMVHGTTKE